MRSFKDHNELDERISFSGIINGIKKGIASLRKKLKMGQTVKLSISIPKPKMESSEPQGGEYTEVMYLYYLAEHLYTDGANYDLYAGGKKYSLQTWESQYVPTQLHSLERFAKNDGKTRTAPQFKPWDKAAQDGALFTYEEIKRNQGHPNLFKFKLVHTGGSAAKSGKEDVQIFMSKKSSKELTNELRLSLKTGVRSDTGEKLGGHHSSSTIGKILPAIVSGTPYNNLIPDDVDAEVSKTKSQVDAILQQIDSEDKRITKELMKAEKAGDKKAITKLNREFTKNVTKPSEALKTNYDNGKYKTMETYLERLCKELKINSALDSDESMSAYLTDLYSYFSDKDENLPNAKGNPTVRTPSKLKQVYGDKSKEVEQYTENQSILFKNLGLVIEKLLNNPKYKETVMTALIHGGVHKPGVDIVTMNLEMGKKHKLISEDYTFAVATTLYQEGYQDFVKSLITENTVVKVESGGAAMNVLGMLNGSLFFKCIIGQKSGDSWRLRQFKVVDPETGKLNYPGELYRKDNIEGGRYGQKQTAPPPPQSNGPSKAILDPRLAKFEKDNEDRIDSMLTKDKKKYDTDKNKMTYDDLLTIWAKPGRLKRPA